MLDLHVHVNGILSHQDISFSDMTLNITRLMMCELEKQHICDEEVDTVEDNIRFCGRETCLVKHRDGLNCGMVIGGVFPRTSRMRVLVCVDGLERKCKTTCALIYLVEH